MVATNNKVWMVRIIIDGIVEGEVLLNWTRQGALDALAAWCREYWQDIRGDEPAPEDDSELIKQYFDSFPDGDEWYIMTVTEVGS